MKKILVTGANGQLGQCLQKLAVSEENWEFVFADSKTLDISDKKAVLDLLKGMSLKQEYAK